MLDWNTIDTVKKVAPYLEGFKPVGKYTWNFRCPICGDSKKDRSKMRGYFYPHPKKPMLMFKCHNHNGSMTFEQFLDATHPEIANDFRLDRYRERPQKIIVEPVKPPKQIIDMDMRKFLKLAIPVSELPSDHPCKQYIIERQIPVKAYPRLFWINDIRDIGHEKLQKFEEGRLVIPSFFKDGKLQGMTMRDITGQSKKKYIALKLDGNDDTPMVFGIENFSLSHQAYIMEGPIDSLFFDNGYAVGGSSFQAGLQFFDKSRTTIILDNQPRNPDVAKNYRRYCEEGWRLFIPPEGFTKDINEAIQEGIVSVDKLKDFVNENSYSGMRLKLQLAKYLKGVGN